MLKLFTKDNCVYCHFLKEKLDDWGMEYTTIHNQALPPGHKTYPQLYFDHIDVQRGPSTDLTKKDLEQRLEQISWSGQDSGAEGQL